MNQSNQQVMAQKIRTRYEERQSTDLDALRELDGKVKRPVNLLSYLFGSISAIVMGCGMSLVMTDIASSVGIGGNPMIPGILIGIAGLAMALINYPLHKAIMNLRKKKYAPQIITLSDKIMGDNE